MLCGQGINVTYTCLCIVLTSPSYLGWRQWFTRCRQVALYRKYVF